MNKRVLWSALGAVILAVVAVAAGGLVFGGGDSSTPVSADGPGPLSTAVAPGKGPAPGAAATTVNVTVGPYTIPPAQLTGWLAVASERERPLLEDGVLTFAEYQSAVLDAVACIERGGVKVVHFPGYGRGGVGEPGPRLSSRGVYSYAGSVQGSSGSVPADAARVVADCKAGSAQVEFIWAQHTAPSEVELQAMRDAMAVCLREAGASVPEAHPSDVQLKAAKQHGASDQAYWTCQFAAADAFEIDRLPG
ncbi:MAG: hypothetical protein IT301_10295 [Dehalococcoidia bacterium]|nr:hypothetical protein [Dehalococcoidia bacterium]